MIVRGYSLDLYCENAAIDGDICGTGRDGIHGFREFPATYFGETRQECVGAARRDGWTVNIKDGKCICPKCNKKRGKK